ncbi:hypothetical protein [Tenacibaculum mesophilum]|uniref:hypothetical protein n=1 Tax=Tenacibaculum mesophilum TaxID=104268 RepID=UPI002491C134|nr:hypothetical protein [Tenacibaculum mesophilum]
MSATNEYTYWHLTPNGWVSGDSKTDFGKRIQKKEPNDTVLTILYKEYQASHFSKMEITQERTFEIKDKDQIAKLEEEFPFKPYIDLN